jgi:hypothetical protein
MIGTQTSIDVLYGKHFDMVTTVPSLTWQLPNKSDIENCYVDRTKQFKRLQQHLEILYPPEPVRLVLTTMVKNEEKVIQRLLDSCRDKVNAVFCLDTGSTDSTIVKVKEWCERETLPYQIDQERFINFGETRTSTLQRCRKFIHSRGWPANRTWMLLLDGDMVLESKDFKLEDLKTSFYKLEQGTGATSWWNARILRADIQAKYYRRTHEYLGAEDTSPEQLSSLRIKDYGDGGCKADKYVRDERLLLEDLQETPDDPRTLYYLGQTLEAMGRTSEARDYYRRRTLAGAWEEEAWMAQYRLGLLIPGPEGERELERAFMRRPSRSEPLLALCNRLLDLKKQQRACEFAQIGLSIPYPVEDTLFINQNCYKYGFSHVLSIGSYYCQDKFNGLYHCDRLRLLRGSPYHESCMQNMRYYVKQLDATRLVLPFETDSTYHPCNPTLLPVSASKLGICIRTVNYVCNEEGGYDASGPEAPAIHSQSWWTVWNMKGAMPDTCLSKIKLQNFYSYKTRVRGIEDIRIYSCTEGWLQGFGTCLDWKEEGGRPRIHNIRWDVLTGKIESCIPISEPDKIEKNWLPFVHGQEKLSFIYSHSPMKVGSLAKNGEITWDVNYQPPFNGSDFRGGTSPIQDKHGAWVWIVHEVFVKTGQKRRTYLHRFMAADPEFKKVLVSAPFYLDHLGIEFCSGLTAVKGGYLLGYGNEDKEACISFVSTDTVMHLLRESAVS